MLHSLTLKDILICLPFWHDAQILLDGLVMLGMSLTALFELIFTFFIIINQSTNYFSFPSALSAPYFWLQIDTLSLMGSIHIVTNFPVVWYVLRYPRRSQ